MRRFVPISAAALLAAAFAGPSLVVAAPSTQDVDAARLDKALAGKIAGEPVNCIPLKQVNGTSYYGDHTILYRMSSRLTYRNEPAGGCVGLRRDAALITRTPSTRLCSSDIAQVKNFATGFTGGSCALSQFVPYRSQ